MKICSKIWNWASKFLILREEEEIEKKPSLMDMLQDAHREVQEAENLFARVEGKEMVDYAILNLQAAEKRYNYLLKAVRQPEKPEQSLQS